VYARILPGLASSTNPAWSMFAGGPELHGDYPDARLPNLVSKGSAILDGPVTLFPNPVLPNHDGLSVRYRLGTELASAAEVHVTTFNLAGEEVDTRRGTVAANTENVVTIPRTLLASGVYFCRVQAFSGDRVETRLERFAVVR
jgi:hypothetical protein